MINYWGALNYWGARDACPTSSGAELMINYDTEQRQRRYANVKRSLIKTARGLCSTKLSKTEFTLAPLALYTATSFILFKTQQKSIELSRPKRTSLREEIKDLIATFDL